MKKFKLKASSIHKWKRIGYFVASRQQVEVWTKEKDADDSVRLCFLTATGWITLHQTTLSHGKDFTNSLMTVTLVKWPLNSKTP